MNCILCNSDCWEKLNEDYLICSLCELIRVTNVPDASLYQFENYCKYQYENGYLPFHLKFENDLQIANLRINYLTKYVNQGRLLDIGCGSGAFVHCASEKGFKAVGYEKDWLVAAVASRISKSHITSLIEHEYYDIVTLFDVLEHLPDPFNIPNSEYLHIEVPIYSGESNWKHFKSKEHIWCFTTDTIKLIVNKLGYKVLEQYIPYTIEGQLLNSKLGIIAKQ